MRLGGIRFHHISRGLILTGRLFFGNLKQPRSEGLGCFKFSFGELSESVVKRVPILVKFFLLILEQRFLPLFIPFISPNFWTNGKVGHVGFIDDAEAICERNWDAFSLFVALGGQKRRSLGFLLVWRRVFGQTLKELLETQLRFVPEFLFGLSVCLLERAHRDVAVTAAASEEIQLAPLVVGTQCFQILRACDIRRNWHALLFGIVRKTLDVH